MIFAFGPNETYFFDDGNGNCKWRAGPEFNAHMISRQIGTIHAAALGEDGAFFLNYTTIDGLQHMNEWQDPQSRYDALYAWLFTEGVPHERKSVCVSLGKQGSFFAASSQGHRWRNIPESLQEHYQKFTRVDLFIKSRVNSVDLGVNDTFLGVGVDDKWFWNLESQYPELSTMIGQKGINNLRFITINPFAPNQHIAFFSNNTVHWCLPPLWIQDIQELFRRYANKAGAHIPQTPPSTTPSLTPPLPQRPQISQTSSNTSSGRWRPSWNRHSSNASQHSSGHGSPPMSPPMSPPPQPPVVQGPGGSQFDWNQAMGTTQSVLDALNNAQGQGQGQGQNQYGDASSGGGTLSSGLNTLNNVSNGLQLVNTMASSGLMIGQLAGQYAGAAAACCVM